MLLLAAAALAVAGGRSAVAQSPESPELPTIQTNLPGSAVQLPTFGVAIDPQGVLSLRAFNDPDGALRAERLRAARAQMPENLLAATPLRKVSLRRLEVAVERCLREHRPLDDVMLHLAGLQRVRYVFGFPDERDILLAGPAEGWAADAAGRPCGIGSGQPVLELADLAAALRAVSVPQPVQGFFGCSIDPTSQGLAKLQAFQRTVPHSVPEGRRDDVARQVAAGMQEALGRAPIRVFGLPADTHLAAVLVEADYRMKRIGIGLETPPVRMSSYLDLLGPGGVQHGALQRWWFVPRYEALRVPPDRLALELAGPGVQLLSETKMMDRDGWLHSGSSTSRASEMFALGFSRRYGELASHSAVYGQLRNAVDLLVAAEFIRGSGLAERCGCRLAVFEREEAVLIHGRSAPLEVAVAVNVAWKGSQMFALAGGGVSIRPRDLLRPDRQAADGDGHLARLRTATQHWPDAQRWWWD